MLFRSAFKLAVYKNLTAAIHPLLIPTKLFSVTCHHNVVIVKFSISVGHVVFGGHNTFFKKKNKIENCDKYELLFVMFGHN